MTVKEVFHGYLTSKHFTIKFQESTRQTSLMNYSKNLKELVVEVAG